MKEWGGGGGWTVAFSSPDKSKKEGVVINVPKWPRVTGRPSPVTALKRGHLHDHPSRRQIQTHTLHTPCQCMRVCVCMYGLNNGTHSYLVYKYLYTQPHANIPLAHVWHISQT